MNHKRKRPKSSRAGCLLCKPHKKNGCHEERASVAQRLQVSREERRDRHAA
jgi:hypothetical protein